jgi:hypothetical protein
MGHRPASLDHQAGSLFPELRECTSDACPTNRQPSRTTSGPTSQVSTIRGQSHNDVSPLPVTVKRTVHNDPRRVRVLLDPQFTGGTDPRPVHQSARRPEKLNYCFTSTERPDTIPGDTPRAPVDADPLDTRSLMLINHDDGSPSPRTAPKSYDGECETVDQFTASKRQAAAKRARPSKKISAVAARGCFSQTRMPTSTVEASGCGNIPTSQPAQPRESSFPRSRSRSHKAPRSPA